MARMVRKQIYIEQSEDEKLKRQAAEVGISEAELIRRRIKQSVRATVSYPTRPEAWQEEVSFINERARLQDLKRARGWTREELYEERFERYSR